MCDKSGDDYMVMGQLMMAMLASGHLTKQTANGMFLGGAQQTIMGAAHVGHAASMWTTWVDYYRRAMHILITSQLTSPAP